MNQSLRLLTFIFLIGISLVNSAQSLSGLNGLATIPSAEMFDNGTIVIGSSYFDKHNLEYGSYQYNGLAGYVALTFLPFVELSFRYTSQLTTISRENKNFPDRMPSARIRVVKESKWIPAIAIGAHDISSVDGGGAKHFEATYFVLTKNFTAQPINIKVNSGYGLALLPASDHSVKGLFGGMAISAKNIPNLQGILEYDSEDLNAAVKCTFWNHLQLMAVAREFRYLEGNITFRTSMK